MRIPVLCRERNICKNSVCGHRSKSSLIYTEMTCAVYDTAEDSYVFSCHILAEKGEGSSIAHLDVQREEGEVEKEYVGLKPIRGRVLYEDGACTDELEKFISIFGFSQTPKFEDVMRVAKGKPSWMDFLLSHGYIREKDRQTFCIGDTLTVDNHRYMLSASIGSEVSLVCIDTAHDGVCGTYVGSRIRVGDCRRITELELKAIVPASMNFEEVAKTIRKGKY